MVLAVVPFTGHRRRLTSMSKMSLQRTNAGASAHNKLSSDDYDMQIPVESATTANHNNNASGWFSPTVASSFTSPSTNSVLWLKVVWQLLVSLILGFLFGVALEKTRVFEPKSIRLQMVFERWIMVKMFLAALASSLISLSLLSLLPPTRKKFQVASEKYVACVGKKGILTSCIGPFVLGIGMTITGACPGMVLVQVGTWTPNAIFTLIGCLLGALLYGFIAPYLDPVIQPRQPFQNHQVHTKFNKPFTVFALPLSVCVAVPVILLEIFVDYRNELEDPELLSTNIVRTVAWPPYIGGILIGILQVPMVLLLEDTTGGSSSYVTVVSQWVIAPSLQRKFPYLASYRTGIGNWWQVLYVGGAVLGGLISATLSYGDLASVQGVGIIEAILGGTMMLLGARLAGGCTSGHGISGVSLLVWLSILAVPCMFGGAIVTAFIMRAADASLDRLVNSTLHI